MNTPEPPAATVPSTLRYALLGNPNTGKTTLFNRLCGARARTGNYPGITVDARFGRCQHEGQKFEIADLPGVYGLDLEQPEAELCAALLEGRIPATEIPDAALIVVDANNLARNLVLVAEVIMRGLPVVVALNMMDLARSRGLAIDVEALRRELGDLEIVELSARTGEGLPTLLETMSHARPSSAEPPDGDAVALAGWAREVSDRCTRTQGTRRASTDRWDRWLIHPVGGLVVFACVMTGLFMALFQLADLPMTLIEETFGALGSFVAAHMSDGALRSLLVDGVIAGVAGTAVFLPQIFLLFFLISLLEDTGYLARAAFVVDRLLRRFGLPGHAFVPLLSSHACAIPGIMCTRLIPDRRDRLATIFIAPFMSCSARLPVYVLLTGFLFADRPALAGLAFAGCYVLGAGVAVLSALLLRVFLLPGRSRPMALELPSYKRPSVRSAVLLAWDRSLVFLRKAGTVILAICMVMWWFSTYPTSEPPAAAVELRAQAAQELTSNPEGAAALELEADRLESQHGLRESFAGRAGRLVEPLFSPLGYDWQLSIAILTSFAAREVFVSTLAVVVGSDAEDPEPVLERVRSARRSDGSPLLTPGVAASLLVFYVLAMQCLPTLAVTRRETGGWKWALLQLAYMTAVAYVFAFATRWSLELGGIA